MNKQDCVMLIDEGFVKVCEVDFPDILSRALVRGPVQTTWTNLWAIFNLCPPR